MCRHNLCTAYQEVYERAQNISLSVTQELKSLSYYDIDIMNKCGRFYETDLMSNEDYLSTAYDIHENYLTIQNHHDGIFHESTAWKQKVLHATQLERSEYERKINFFEDNIRSLISHILNE